MTAAASTRLAPEWERVELLARCAGCLRQGEALDESALARLRAVQVQVEEGRAGGAWRALAPVDLEPIAHDLLAFAIAPEMEPRVGWLYQALQPGLASPYPSLALVQEMLALRAAEAGALRRALAEGSPLRALRLVELDEGGPFQPIRPGVGVAEKLLGVEVPRLAPPGSLPVAGAPRLGDLVLPPDRRLIIEELLAMVRLRRKVIDEWGARAGGGPVALFHGPSGTGKTFAASVLAAELGWPLFRTDLGALVSKYVGETEKNLNRLFAAAHGRPMVLQFDEADALFGKRGEVRDAHDRWANLEVSHLLARIELHDGPVVLTTNLRGNLDAAFARRFHVVVEFPLPDAAARARLWRLHLAPRAPRSPDLDLDAIAAVPLSGGQIHHAALRAAHLAAAAERPIGMAQLALAVSRELAKEGRSPAAAQRTLLASWLTPSGEDARC